MIFDEPTRGIDVGAKNEIYELMRALADARRRHPDDLQRHGGGDRRQRPDRRDARRRHQRLPRAQPQFSEQNVLQLAVGNDRQEIRRPLKMATGRAVGCDAEGPRACSFSILVVGTVGGAHQPALPVADQPRQHRQPDRPVRPVLASAQAFVIITGGIELSVGSIIALLGVIFIDL